MSKYSNSPLVSHTKISPNKSAPRNKPITKITIHHVAGVLSAETIGNVFQPAGRRASSNYGIGNDGRVGMYVEEKDRAWTSSSGANDNQAITIEVSNSATGGEWPVGEKAYATLINLCVDICKRNGIPKLVYDGTPNGSLTHHQMFAATACPGQYLLKRFPQICAEVNKRLDAPAAPQPAVPQPAAPSPAKPAAPTAANDAAIWAHLKGKGFNDFAIAGLMGNLYAESGLQPVNLQNTFNTRLNMTDAAYTQAVDSGAYANFVRDGAGYGLAQWTFWSRKQALLDFAKAARASIGDLKMQLDFLWKELQGYSGVMAALKNAKTVAEASNVVLLQYEKPADQSAAIQKRRADFGQGYYNRLAGKTAAPSTPSGVLYRVQCGAFAQKANAAALEKKLKAAGYETIVVANGALYRVQCGAFSKRANADALAAKLKAQGFDTYITTFAG